MTKDPTPVATSARYHPALRSALLFLNFFVILLAYYQVKPASRSLFLEYSDASQLPYVWTASGVLLLMLMPFYQRLIQRFERIPFVVGTCAVVVALLLAFRLLLNEPGPAVAVGFYIFVDIISVVLVEQFWSLTNSLYDKREGRHWYGLIASGGLLGGLVGGFAASWLVAQGGLTTEDLIVVAALLLAGMMALTWRMAAAGMYREAPRRQAEATGSNLAMADIWQSLTSNRVVGLLALLLLASQVCEPLVEYQFMHIVEASYSNAEVRTAYLSGFLGVLSGAALGINLLITPLLHRYGGAIAGMMVQPILLGCSAFAFAMHADLRSASLMKIADRSLSYSVNRASRELFYISADARTIFKVKAWIDMVGYRAFRIVGNCLILLMTQVLPWQVGDRAMSGVVLAVCCGWTFGVLALHRATVRSRHTAPPTLSRGGPQEATT
ncbi:MAG TPA: Npt1/Npt2 family nucleotide transporter [Solimonas sp.]|nr:Npt1/Npt2 family nucleotide transporter [Solimonas sp.]